MIEEEKARQGKKREWYFSASGRTDPPGTGLGPLIGYKLRDMKRSCAAVFGTLERPVHAMNLEEYARIIKTVTMTALWWRWTPLWETESMWDI